MREARGRWGYPALPVLKAYEPLSCAPRPARRFVLALVAAALPLACKSAAEHRAEADDEVYAILDEVRTELAAEGTFTIDPPTDSLRARILSGQVPAADEPLLLDLESSLRVAAENSREFQDRREALYLAALDLTLERWRFSPQEAAGATGFVSGDGSDTDARGLLSTLGITKLFTSGARFTGTFGLDFLRTALSGDAWGLFSNFSFGVTQPLLRGFGAKIVREPLTQAERDVFYEVRAFERFRRTFGFDVTSRYLRILEDMNTLENEQGNFESLTQLRIRNENFADAGRLSDIQVDQARQDELRALNRVVEARRSLEARLDDFKLLLGLPVGVGIALEPSALQTIAAWEALELEIDEALALGIALQERLDHLTTMARVEDAARRVEVAAEGLRTGLDAGFALGPVSSAEDRPSSFGGSSKPWELTLDLDLPIDRLPERNAYRESLIALGAAQRQAEESADRVGSELRDARRSLEAARESREIQSGAVILAERRVESASLNLEAGRASTRDLLEAQEALVQAQNAASRALTDFVLAGLAYYRDLEFLRVSEAGLSIDTGALVLETEQDTP